MSDYSRIYSKGYAAGYRRAKRWSDKLIDAVRRATARAEQAEERAGIGHCRTCKHCRPATAYWGNCTAYAVAQQTIDDPWFGENTAITPRIAPPVSFNFGCVLHVPRTATPAP